MPEEDNKIIIVDPIEFVARTFNDISLKLSNIQTSIESQTSSASKEESTQMDLSEQQQLEIKRYKKTTRIFLYRNVSTSIGEKIFAENGMGVLREITVVANQKINIEIELDEIKLFGARSVWDDLASISLYSDTVMARLVGSDYVLNLKELNFKHSLSIFVWFSTDATISGIFGVYDLCEVL